MSLMDNNATGSFDISHAQRTFALCIFTMASILGIAGNILVIVAVALSQQLHTPTNIFVIALAVIDLITCLLLPVQVISLAGTDGSVTFDLVCSVVAVCSHIFFGISVSILTLIAYNRFFLITKSIAKIAYTRLFTKRNISVALVIFGGVISIVTVVFAATGLATFGRAEGICAQVQGVAFTYISGVWLLLCLIVILVCYVKIYNHVKRHPRSIAARKISTTPTITNDASTTEASQPTLQSACSAGEAKTCQAGFVKRQRELESKITTNMLIIIVLFLLCVSPAIITLLIPGDQQASAIIMAMIALNSCLNPVVYAWKHPVFSHIFKCILKGRLSQIKEPTQFARYLRGPHTVNRSNGNSYSLTCCNHV